MRLFFLSLAALPVIVSLMGCAGHAQADPGIEVLITDVFPNNDIQAGTAPVTLSAEVMNGKQSKGVTWSLTTAGTACSPACGTLVPVTSSNLSAVYTPPAQAPLNQQATISAISVEDPTQSYPFIFTIVPAAKVSITDKFASILAGAVPVAVNASIENDSSDSGASWTLTANGANCSPVCGTLSPAAAPSLGALYTPPPAVPSGANANPTITATSVAHSSAADSFSFTIASPASLVNGSYVFLLRGYYSFSGDPMAMAGTIVADGKGSITSGEIDFNNDGGINHVPPPATGTYAVDNSVNGVTKVSVEISSYTFPGSNIDLRFRFALSSDGKRGHIIEFDGSGYLDSGTIQRQDASALSAAPSGNFAFGLDSDAPLAGRSVAAGQLNFGASGITGGIIDQSVAGAPAPLYSAAPIGPGAVSAPDSNGRGTLAVTVNNITSNYAYYFVNSDEIRLIQIDRGLQTGTVQAGTAVRQKTLTPGSINATSVLQLTGMDVPSGTNTPGPDVLIGVMNISNGSAFNLTFDSNDLGTVLTSHPAAGSIASFDPATGRAVLSYPGGFESAFVDSAVIYLYDRGSGFFIDTDITSPSGTPPNQSITNMAFSGTLTLQAGAPFPASALSGNLIAGFGGSASSDIPNWDLAVNLNSSNLTYSAEGELTSLPSQDGLATNAQFTGTYGWVNSAIGHGQLTIPTAVFGDFTPGKTATASFYLMAPNQFVLIGVQPGLHSGVAFFDPQ